MDGDRLGELRVWLALASTNLPEARDELVRQSVEWDRLIRSLVADTRMSDDAAVSLVGLVDGLALRLLLDSTRRARRGAEAALDDLLRSCAAVAR